MMNYMATPQHQNPYPRGHAFYNFGRPFLRQHYYILSLSDLCLVVKEEILKGIMHFQYKTYMPTPYHKKPYPEGHEIYNFWQTLPCSQYYCILSLSDLCLVVKEEIFKEEYFFKKYINYTHLNPILPLRGVGVMEFLITCLLTLHMLNTKAEF